MKHYELIIDDESHVVSYASKMLNDTEFLISWWSDGLLHQTSANSVLMLSSNYPFIYTVPNAGGPSSHRNNFLRKQWGSFFLKKIHLS